MHWQHGLREESEQEGKDYERVMWFVYTDVDKDPGRMVSLEESEFR